MKIPLAFTLFGQRIVVTWRDDLIEKEGAGGLARMTRNEIELQNQNCASLKRPRSLSEKTFLHEMLHLIFHFLGEDELRDNEVLVDRMALLLHQALTTAEYEETEDGDKWYSPLMGG